MFCEFCGEQLREGTDVCHVCGREQRKMPVNTKENRIIAKGKIKGTSNNKRNKGKKKKVKVVLISIISVMILSAIVYGIVIIKQHSSLSYKIIKALEKEDYEEALSLFSENYNQDDEKDISKALESRLKDVEIKFKEDSIEYEIANMEIMTIEKMNIKSISESLNNTKQSIQSLNASRTAYSTAEEMSAGGNYSGAIEQYKMVIEDDKNYESAKEKLVGVIEKYRKEVLKEAAEDVEKGSYKEAIVNLENALNVVSDDKEISKQLTIYKEADAAKTKSDVLEKAKEYAEASNYEMSLKTLSQAMSSYKDDNQLKEAYNEYSKLYENNVIGEVDSLVAEGNYNQAVTKITAALKILNGNAALSEKLSEVEESKPVSLSTLTPLNGGWEWNVGIPTDPFGVTYSNVSNYAIFNGYSWDKNFYSEYRLYGKYKTLTFSIVPQEEIAENGHGKIQVYVDDALAFTSPEVGRKTDCASYSVNIGNAEYIKIVVDTNGDRSCNVLLIMDFMLYK